MQITEDFGDVCREGGTVFSRDLFPMIGRFAWVKVISQNWRTIFKLAKEAFDAWRGAPLRSVLAREGVSTSLPTKNYREDGLVEQIHNCGVEFP
jgi:hypothetical protein